jgi:hypothetical protein
MARLKIHGMVVGAIDGYPENPPLPPWIWLKPAQF